jgi:tetratricopeptide (TPR) repeat protein
MRRLALVVALAACSRTDPPTPPGGGPSAARLVFRDASGRELTMHDLEGVSGTVNWELVGGDAVPAAARRLHEQARGAGERGDYDRAIALLEQARAAAPAWPYPVYDEAYTYELKDDPAKAESLYAEVDRLAPRGFFTAKTSLDCLRREHGGALPAGLCKAYAMTEFLRPAEQQAALEALVAKAPGFAPAWKDLASLAADDGAKLADIEHGLGAAPDDETRGMLLIDKALVLDRRGDHAAAIELLGTLALDPRATLASEALAKATLAQIVSR